MKQINFLLAFIFAANALFAQNNIYYSNDNLGRLTQAVYPDSSSYTYSYDNNGNRLSKRANDPCANKPRPVITAPVPAFLCLGDSVTLSTAGGLKYSWSNGDTSQSIAVNTEGYYWVTQLDAFLLPGGDTLQCYLRSDTVNVFTTLPGINGPDILCVGATITLNDSVSGGTWSSSNSSVASVGPSTGLVKGISGGTTTITYSPTTGCYVSLNVTVGSATGPPQVASVSPAIGYPGSSVSIIGTNFCSSPVNNVVYFGATKANVLSATTTALNVSVPTGATYMPVTVDNITCALTGSSKYAYMPTYNDSAYIQDTVNFDPIVNFFADSAIQNVVIGDIDGDGKADMIVVNNGSNTISVFRNISTSGSINSGSFAPKVDFVTGSAPVSVAIGDLDGDGKLDIVVANQGSNSISVFFNTATEGSITLSSLAAKVDFTDIYTPINVAIGDIDQDGKPEILVNHFTYGSPTAIAVLRNLSSIGTINPGSFAAAVDFDLLYAAYDLAIGDIDGDGKLDLIASSYGYGFVNVLHNTSTPGIISASSFAYPLELTSGGAMSTSVALGDIDGDGKPDIVVGNSFADPGYPVFSIFHNTSTSGSISFGPAVDFYPPAPATGGNGEAITLSDIDGDGKPDIIASNWILTSTSSIFATSVYLNASSPGSITTSSIGKRFDVGPKCSGMAIGDLDGDGKPDLALVNGNNNIEILRNDPVSNLPPITGSTNVCTGSTITLSDGTSGGNWSSSNTIVATVDPINGVVTGLTSGLATISYYYHGSYVTIPIIANSSPAITLGTIPSICYGDTVVSIPYTAASTGLSYTLTWDSAALAQGFSNIGNAGGIITTIAGNNTAGYSGDDGDATAAQLNYPTGLSVDSNGNIYIADYSNGMIRKVNTSGIISKVAGGGGGYAYSGDGGLAIDANLWGPYGAATDNKGNVYAADWLEKRIRKINSSGIINTIAGGAYSSAEGIPAINAYLNQPMGVAVDINGNIYISNNDFGCSIKKVDTSGIITTIAGDGGIGYYGDGGLAIDASIDASQGGITVDGSGNIYIADFGNGRIRKVNTAGIITTVAGDGTFGAGGDGGLAIDAELSYPAGVAVDGNGNIYIADQYNNRIRKVNPLGIITTVAGNGSSGYSGDGGTAIAAALSSPWGIAVDKSGNIYISDNGNNCIRKVSSNNIPLPSSPVSILAPGTAIAGTYTGTITLSNGTCTNSSYPFTVMINPMPSYITGLSNVCAGSSITLTDTVSGGTWSSSNTSIASVSEGIVTGIVAGMDTIIYSYTTPCGITTASVSITVNPQPSAITGTTNVCRGSITALSDSGSGAWHSSNNLIAMVDVSGNVFGISPGVSNIIYTLPTGCTTATTVTVNGLPSVITGTRNICMGSETSLNDISSPGSWSSSDTTIATVDVSGNVSGLSAGISNITYALVTGCIVTAPVIISPLPPAITGTMNVCAGYTTALTDSGGGVWSSNNTSVTTVDIWGNVTGITVGTSNIIYKFSTGCSSATTVTVNAVPTISGGTSSSICAGSTDTLTATGGTTYSWLPATGLSATTGASVTATPTITTTYTVTGTTSGCSNTATNTLTVNAIPAINAGTASAICAGSTATLTATGGTTYSWSPVTGLSATLGASITATPTVTTTYTVTGITSGCSNTATNTITVNAILTINAGTGSAICAGDTATLTATGGTTYSWSPATGLSATTGASITATPTVTTTYTVTGTTTGCSNIATNTVTVNAIPTISAGTAAAICTGGTAILTATGGTTYSWSPGTGLSATTGASITATPTVTTTYTVTGTTTGCSNTATNTITVNAIPTISAGIAGAICAGSTATLTATGGTTYSWSPATGLSAITGASITATPTVTTTYTVTGTTTGCSNTATTAITVNAIPTISAGASASICAGSIASLTATGGSTYSWSPTTGLSAPTGASIIATPTVTSTYTVTGTTTGCSNTATKTITVTPIPTISAGTALAICAGSTATLTATGGTTYSWSPATGLSGTTGVSITAMPTVTTTYTVTGTTTGCSNMAASTVTVNAMPAISTGTVSPICAGTTATLTATGGTTYSWSPATGLSATTGASITATPAVTTTYTVTGTTTGCSNTAASTVTVNAIPTISTGTVSPICAGSTTSLTATGGSTYSWSPATGLSATTGASITATPAVTTTYTVTGTTTGCSNTAASTVTVNAIPTISTGTVSPICAGSTATLTATGGSTYSWSPVIGLSATTGASITATPAVSTTYTVTGTTTGCSNTATNTITVNAMPAISTGTVSPICAGSTATLTATGGTTYSWSPATGLSATTGASITATPAVTTTYTVTGTMTGCSNTAKDTIIVNALPTIIAGSGVSICAGNSTTLTATGATSYSWIPATALSASIGASVTAIPTITTTYTVTGTNASSCSDTSSITVTVNPLPTVSAGTGVSICAGSATTLTATGGTSYSWTPVTALSASTGASVNANPTVTTIYTVTGTNASGCSDTSSVTITVNPLPTVSAGTGVSICAGSAATFTATGGTSYSWTPVTALSASSGASVTASPAVTTIYTVTGTNASGCSDTSSVTVTVNPLANSGKIGGVDTVCESDSIVLTETATGGLWSTTNGNAVVTTGGLVYGIVTGVDTIKYSAGNSCDTAVSQKIIQIINCSAGVNNISQVSDIITLYPNPTQNNVTISSSGTINKVIISDLLGQTVFSEVYNTNELIISLNSLANGVYIVKINGIKVYRVVKE